MSLLKSIAFALTIAVVIVGLLYATEHLNLTGRAPMSLDLATLSAQEERKALLARFPEQKFSCGEDKSGLGKQVCHAEIQSFNDIPARYVAFFFNDAGELTGFKLAAYASQHAALVETFNQRFGPVQRLADAPVLAWPAGAGALTMPASVTGQEATVLWVTEPGVVAEVRRLADAEIKEGPDK